MLLIKNLNFRYGENKIINGFSYQFETWKIYGIFWKSWSWKTTLARVMSGFLKPSEWIEMLDQKKIVSPSQDIIYISQRDDTFYRLTVYQNLYILCHDKKRVEDILEKVDLIAHKNKFLKELSWGMIRCLSFARILLLMPKVLILDEPFVHLDVKAKKKLIDILLDIHKINKWMIIILISHNISEMKITDTLISFKNSIDRTYNEKKTDIHRIQLKE